MTASPASIIRRARDSLIRGGSPHLGFAIVICIFLFSIVRVERVVASRVADCVEWHHSIVSSICRMSAARHAVVRGPSLTAFGARPLFTHDHHVAALIGSTESICGSLTYPMSGMPGVSRIRLG